MPRVEFIVPKHKEASPGTARKKDFSRRSADAPAKKRAPLSPPEKQSAATDKSEAKPAEKEGIRPRKRTSRAAAFAADDKPVTTAVLTTDASAPEAGVKPARKPKKNAFAAFLTAKLGPNGTLYAGGFIAVIIMAACAFVVPAALEPDVADVVLNDNGFKVHISSDDETVGDLLESTGVTVSEYDMVACDLSDEITDGMEIDIHRAMRVNVMSGAEAQDVFMLGGTVADALELAGVTVGELDEVYPGSGEYTTPDMTINHIIVTKEVHTTTEQIGFKVVEENNPQLKKGTQRVAVKGSEGTREVEVEVTYKNGVETGREKIGSTVLVEPVDQVVEIGTKPDPTPTPKPTPKPTKKPSASKTPASEKSAEPEGESEEPAEEDNGLLKKTPSSVYSSTLHEHKSKAAPDSSIIDYALVAQQVTAYTHTGRKTASGTWPQIGTVACYWKSLAKGTKIYVPGYGYGIIEDQGGGTNASVIHLDLFMDTSADCSSWGRKRNVEFYVLK